MMLLFALLLTIFPLLITVNSTVFFADLCHRENHSSLINNFSTKQKNSFESSSSVSIRSSLTHSAIHHTARKHPESIIVVVRLWRISLPEESIRRSRQKALNLPTGAGCRCWCCVVSWRYTIFRLLITINHVCAERYSNAFVR